MLIPLFLIRHVVSSFIILKDPSIVCPYLPNKPCLIFVEWAECLLKNLVHFGALQAKSTIKRVALNIRLWNCSLSQPRPNLLSVMTVSPLFYCPCQLIIIIYDLLLVLFQFPLWNMAFKNYISYIYFHLFAKACWIVKYIYHFDSIRKSVHQFLSNNGYFVILIQLEWSLLNIETTGMVVEMIIKDWHSMVLLSINSYYYPRATIGLQWKLI